MGKFWSEHWFDVFFVVAILATLGMLHHALKPPDPIVLTTCPSAMDLSKVQGGP